MSFIVQPLPSKRFSHLYGKSDAVLKKYGVISCIADLKKGFPCRVTLHDADPGERLLLMNFEHQPANTPYKASHAIFVIDGAREIEHQKNKVPPIFIHRLLSVRAFDNQGMMIEADVVPGTEAASCFDALLAKSLVSYLHVHTAKQGCYLARVVRA